MVWQRPAMSGAVLVSLLLLSASTGCGANGERLARMATTTAAAPATTTAPTRRGPRTQVPGRMRGGTAIRAGDEVHLAGASGATTVAAPPLSLPIESESDGLLVTGYEAVHQGDWHILRHWQERSRYVIRLSPDWDQPTQRTHIEVSVQTQQRAASNQSFDDSPELDRSDRASDLLRQILAGLSTTQQSASGVQAAKPFP